MVRSVFEIASLVASCVAPADIATKVVAIDGQGGSGKSTLSRRLAQALGEVPIVQTDDFASWDTPIDWQARQLAEWHEIPLGDLLVLEGATASRAAFRPHLAFCIWIDTPREERLRRGLARDGEGAVELWRNWMSAEDEYVDREHPDRAADLVISGTVELE